MSTQTQSWKVRGLGRRWIRAMWVLLVVTVGMGGYALVRLLDTGEGGIMVITSGLLTLSFGLNLYAQERTVVRADSVGLHLPRIRNRTIPWEDIADIRPDVPAPWSASLVVERGSGTVIHTGLPPWHEGLLDRWARERDERGPGQSP